MKIRCLAIDDEPLALNVLADYIQQTDFLQLVDITTDPKQGLARMLAGEADLVFLDIQMPGLNGIEFLRQMGEHAKAILTTAYPEYALEGYEFSVVDYLLKPFSYERFLKAAKKIPPASSDGIVNSLPDFFFVKSEYKLVRIDYASVLYLEALRDYIAIHTTDGQKIMTLQSMASFEKELPPSLFTRIHKSYMVAVKHIKLVEKNKVVVGSNALPIGDTYRQRLKEVLSG